jgi:outer membrane lipoprotein-sorting protein
MPAPADTGAPAAPGPAPRPAVSDTAAAARPEAGAGRPTPSSPAATPAQPPAADTQDEGARILRGAARAYADIASLQADFVMNQQNPLLRTNATSRGTLYQRRPDRILLRFSQPAGDVIVGDGTHFWIYYPSVDSAQVMKAPASQAGTGGVDLQAQFVGNPVERFEYALHGTENVGGRPARVLTLVPKQRADYRSLKVWLDTRDALARRFEIVELNGTVRHFDLTGMQVNGSLPDGVFRFTPPAGVRVITAG